jgi:hypothetical protein
VAQSLLPLAPTTAAGQSTDIAVATITAIFLYTADGAFPSGIQCPVLRKKGTVYEPLTDDAGDRVILTSDRREVTVLVPGTYAVSKQLTAFAVGVGTDS